MSIVKSEKVLTIFTSYLGNFFYFGQTDTITQYFDHFYYSISFGRLL